jgi:MFS family permease
MKKAWLKISNFLGLKKNILLLFGLIILIMTGEKMWERFIPKYLEGLGSSILIISGWGFLQNFLASFWSLPGGYIADKIGNKKSFLIFNLMAIGGYVIAIVFTSWIAVFIGLIFFSAWNAIAFPASASLITKNLGAGKTAMGLSMQSITRRIPMMIGPVLGGFLITAYGLIDGIRITFGVSIVLCSIGLLLQRKMTDDVIIKHEKIHPYQLWKKFDPRLKNLLVSDILIRFCEQIPYVFVVIWCLDYIKIKPEQFGYLTAIEMITAALIYLPVASFSDKLERKPFVVITFIFFSVFPVFLYYSSSYWLLVIAFFIRGMKEFGEPTRKAMIMDLSVKNAEARSFGLYYFVRDFVVSFAAFGGGFLWKLGPLYNFWFAGILGLVGTVYFIFMGKGTDKIIKSA